MSENKPLNPELLWHFSLQASFDAGAEFYGQYKQLSQPISLEDWNNLFLGMGWESEELINSFVNPNNVIIEHAIQQFAQQLLAEGKSQGKFSLDLKSMDFSDVPELSAVSIITRAFLASIDATIKQMFKQGFISKELGLFCSDFGAFFTYANQVALQIVTSPYDETGIRLKHLLQGINQMLYRVRALSEFPRFVTETTTILFDYRTVVQRLQLEHKQGVGYDIGGDSGEDDDDDDSDFEVDQDEQ